MRQEEKWLLEEKYNGVESEAFQIDLKRLNAGEPLGYIIGYIPFRNSRIYLDSHPLIPRPETEYWVSKAIDSILKNYKPGMRVLDLCAGSGCIGVAVAEAIPDAQVIFSEIDPTHLPTIKKNLTQLHSIDQIFSDRREYKNGNAQVVNRMNLEEFQVVESNLFKNVTGKFDFILTNPPYIDVQIDRAESSVKNYEPHLALHGGNKGLDVISDIIIKASGYLNQSGQLWIEHEPEQVEDIKSLASQNGFFATAYEDQYGIERYSVLLFKPKDVS